MKTSCPKVFLMAISLLAMVLFFTAYPISGLAVASGSSAYQIPAPEDFSGLPWSEAFEKLHGKFSREYAFTDWKQINWPALYAKFKPQIDRAQASKDFTAYYLALKEYVHSIPDGHVRITAIRDIDYKYIGGGFGFSAAKLSNGKVIVNWVDETSEAYAQGMRPGAELIEWNGQPIEEVLNGVVTVFGPNSATAEDAVNQRVCFLTRAPINTRLSVAFSINGEIARATVVAYNDKGLSFSKIYPTAVVSDGLRELILNVDNPRNPPESMVEKKVLDGNIGYIKIWGELDIDLKNSGKAPSTLGLFRAALAEFDKANVKGLIVDIRNNVGGFDSMAADMLASFYQAEVLYEYVKYFNPNTGSWKYYRNGETGDKESLKPGLYIRPVEPFFGRPVIALINSKCVSTCEGLAMGIRNLPQGETVGFYGTNGSFGMAGDEALMPGGLKISWPFGQSLDKNRQVQLDSREGVGGVSPSIRTPMTKAAALRVANGEDVELEHAIAIINSLAR